MYLLLPCAAFGTVRLARRAAGPASTGPPSAPQFVSVALVGPVLAAVAIAVVFVTPIPLPAAFAVVFLAVFALAAGSLAIGEAGVGRSVSLGLLMAALATAGAWLSLFLLSWMGWSGAM